MAVERKFINEAVKKVKVDHYIHEELKRVGCGEVDVKKTPLGTRVVIHAIKPGLVIGRKGKNIQDLTDTLKEKFKVDNPQLEVQEVDIPEFDPEIMAKQLAATLERGIHFRRATYSMLKQIMDKGALGAQIEISGKISGARARHEKFKQGYIKHCGETARLYVKEATTQAYLKAGVIGIKVKITPPSKEGLFKELKVKEEIEKKTEPKEEPKVKEVTPEMKEEVRKKEKVEKVKEKARKLEKGIKKPKAEKKAAKKTQKKPAKKAVKKKKSKSKTSKEKKEAKHASAKKK